MNKDLETRLTQNMVISATEFGIAIVQQIAAETLQKKPGMLLREFTKVLDRYHPNVQADAVVHVTPPPSE
jgi:hypothetical protein